MLFYNCHRPHAELNSKTPYDVLKQKLKLKPKKIILDYSNNCEVRG